jgi:hypothetical protein
MPATRNQRALAGESLSDGDTPEHSPRTKERLDAVQAAELQLVAEDKKYHASTFAAEVVVYGTGKKFAAVVPAIRRNNKDSDGNWVLLEPKTDRTLQRWRTSIVGVSHRGFCADTGLWGLSEEQATALDSFAWLADIDRTLRGCATREGADGQASADTECRNVLAVAQLCEMVHTEEALTAKASYMEYYTFLQRYKGYHQGCESRPVPTSPSGGRLVTSACTARR